MPALAETCWAGALWADARARDTGTRGVRCGSCWLRCVGAESSLGPEKCRDQRAP